MQNLEWHTLWFLHPWASMVTKMVLAYTKLPIVKNLVTNLPSLENWIPCYFLSVKHLTSAWDNLDHKNDFNLIYWERKKLLAFLMGNDGQMARCWSCLPCDWDHMHNGTMHIKILWKHNINIVYHSDWENLSCISIKKIERTILQSLINSRKKETETKLLNQN